MWLPDWLYERLPQFYLLCGVACALLFGDSVVAVASSMILLVAALIISRRRRKASEELKRHPRGGKPGARGQRPATGSAGRSAASATSRATPRGMTSGRATR